MTSSQHQQDSAQAWNDPSDLAICDNEPIQAPGAIMPHGVMLILSPDDYRVMGVSANILDWLNINSDELLGRHLDSLVSKVVQKKLEAGLASLNQTHSAQFLSCVQTLHSVHRFDVFGHRSGDFMILELESLVIQLPELTLTERFAELVHSITALQNAETWQQSMELAVIELKQMTGFDSVIGVRLLEDGTGHAVAEARETEFASFLDKRFPRSDIPEPARRQMLLMPVQATPDHAFESVPLLLGLTACDALSIDLSRSLLRSTSPMCNQYYMNMGARSRLLLVLIYQGQLWGFFSCLSARPRQVMYAERLAYQLFAEMATLLLVEKVKFEHERETLKAKRLVTGLIDDLSTVATFSNQFTELPIQLSSIINISGSALVRVDSINCWGHTPDKAEIRALFLGWKRRLV